MDEKKLEEILDVFYGLQEKYFSYLLNNLDRNVIFNKETNEISESIVYEKNKYLIKKLEKITFYLKDLKENFNLEKLNNFIEYYSPKINYLKTRLEYEAYKEINSENNLSDISTKNQLLMTNL